MQRSKFRSIRTIFLLLLITKIDFKVNIVTIQGFSGNTVHQSLHTKNQAEVLQKPHVCGESNVCRRIQCKVLEVDTRALSLKHVITLLPASPDEITLWGDAGLNEMLIKRVIFI